MNKKLSIFLLFICVVFYVVEEDRIHSHYESLLKKVKTNQLKKSLHKNEEKVLERTLTIDTLAWYNKKHVIAGFRMGGAYVKDSLSDVSFFIYRYNRGNRLFFVNKESISKIGVYFFKKHKDIIYFIDDIACVDVLKSFLGADADDILKAQIIICYYNLSDYYKFKNEIFKGCVLFQNNKQPMNYSVLTNFCLNHNIYTVFISEEFAADEDIKLLHTHGISTYVETDFISNMQEYKKIGHTGCLSNMLFEDIYYFSDIKK